MMSRICTKCGILKELSEFSPSSKGLYGRQSSCKLCHAEMTRRHAKTESRKNYLSAWKISYKGRKSAMLNAAKKRARDKSVAFGIGHDDFEIPESCPVLGVVLVTNQGAPGPNSPSLDRIDPTLGYIPGNVQVISNRANMMKSDANREDLLSFATWVMKTFPEMRHESRYCNI